MLNVKQTNYKHRITLRDATWLHNKTADCANTGTTEIKKKKWKQWGKKLKDKNDGTTERAIKATD